MLTNGGDPHPNKGQRLFWAVLEGVIAGVLLAAGWAIAGDATAALEPLQSAAVATGLPFSLALVLMSWGLIKGLNQEQPQRPGRQDRYVYPSPPRE